MTSRQDIQREEDNLLEIERSLARVEKTADDNLERIEDTLRLIDEALLLLETNRAEIGKSEYLKYKNMNLQQQERNYELRRENVLANDKNFIKQKRIEPSAVILSLSFLRCLS